MAITIESDEKGNIHFPSEIGIRPNEKLFVDKVDNMIVIKKANKKVGDKIAKILEKNLGNASYKDVEKGREDREW